MPAHKVQKLLYDKVSDSGTALECAIGRTAQIRSKIDTSSTIWIKTAKMPGTHEHIGPR